MNDGLEPVGSHPAGTPPAGETSTAGSNPSFSVVPSDPRPTWETRAGSGVSWVKRAERARERSSLCGVRGGAPQATAPPALSFLDTYEVTRPYRYRCRWRRV